MHKSQIEYQTYNVLSLLTSHADILYNIEYGKSMIILGTTDHGAICTLRFIGLCLCLLRQRLRITVLK